MGKFNKDVISSWEKNAKEWIKVIDGEKIESRFQTNKAIEEVLRAMPAQKIVDVACGEGWLTRSVTKMGKTAVGMDATETLLVNARTKSPEPFFYMTFEDIMAGSQIPDAPYDAAVFNFCLYQKEGLHILLKNTQKSLNQGGEIIIQTLHPFFLKDNGLEYKSQMISDSWKGLPGNFSDGHAWYARTFEDWSKVISKSEMKMIEIREILNPEKKPISLILKIS